MSVENSKSKIEQTDADLFELDIKEFIEKRNIKPEDMNLIKQLETFPKDLIVRTLHNFFTGYKERSAEVLEKQTQRETDEITKKMYGIFLEFAKKYDWYACWHLVGILEGVKRY